MGVFYCVPQPSNCGPEELLKDHFVSLAENYVGSFPAYLGHVETCSKQSRSSWLFTDLHLGFIQLAWSKNTPAAEELELHLIYEGNEPRVGGRANNQHENKTNLLSFVVIFLLCLPLNGALETHQFPQIEGSALFDAASCFLKTFCYIPCCI